MFDQLCPKLLVYLYWWQSREGLNDSTRHVSVWRKLGVRRLPVARRPDHIRSWRLPQRADLQEYQPWRYAWGDPLSFPGLRTTFRGSNEGNFLTITSAGFTPLLYDSESSPGDDAPAVRGDALRMLLRLYTDILRRRYSGLFRLICFTRILTFCI